MAYKICPYWVGYLLLNPIRKLDENPEKILSGLIQEGMIVLEPGCGMGYFTLPMARMVGPNGRVVALEIQAKMLSVLARRARKARLLDRVDLRQAKAEGLGVDDLSGQVDLAAALHMVHETPDKAFFFSEIWNALKHRGRILIVEPRGHVSEDQFEQTLAAAEKIGFKPETVYKKVKGLGALLTKP